MSWLRIVAKGLFSLLTLSWPFIIWFGVITQHMHWITPVLLGLMIIRVVAFLPVAGPMRGIIKTGSLLAILLCLLSLFFNQHEWLMWYPVAVNTLMLIFFGSSLFFGVPIIEQLARLKRPQLPASAIRYTKQVTQIWCGFFLFNGVISMTTVLLNNMTLWGIWNGLLSYFGMGSLIIGEWIFRQWKIR